MHVDFDPSNINWNNEAGLNDDIDDAYMIGGGSASSSFHYAPFSGMPYQRGAGVGSIFRSLLRYLMPLGRQAGSAIAKQGLESTSRVLTSVLDGKQLGQSLADEGRSGLKNLLDKASQNLATAKQGGGGGNFDFRRYKKQLDGKQQQQHGLRAGVAVGDGTEGTSGVFTQPASAINNKIRGVKNNNKQLYSIIGPPTKRKHTNKQQRNNGKGKRLRIDSLGPY
jgi:hypothetical protein